MDYKTINKTDASAYIGLAILGLFIPQLAYRINLLDFSATLAENQINLVKAQSMVLLFLALCFYLLGDNKENSIKLNVVRNVAAVVLIAMGAITEFNAFFIFGVWEGFLSFYTGRELKS